MHVNCYAYSWQPCSTTARLSSPCAWWILGAVLTTAAAPTREGALDAEIRRVAKTLAELIKQIDAIPAERLRADDRTLGANTVVGPDTGREVACKARQPTPSHRQGRSALGRWRRLMLMRVVLATAMGLPMLEPFEIRVAELCRGERACEPTVPHEADSRRIFLRAEEVVRRHENRDAPFAQCPQ